MARSSQTEKMSVTLPKELAGEIRALVPQGEVSSFFAEALHHFLAVHRQRIALQKGFGIWKKGTHSDLLKPADSVAYVRSLRKHDRERLLRVGEQRGK
jgi:dihydropteroate synthase